MSCGMAVTLPGRNVWVCAARRGGVVLRAGSIPTGIGLFSLAKTVVLRERNINGNTKKGQHGGRRTP
jgi:hypothetical protein